MMQAKNGVALDAMEVDTFNHECDDNAGLHNGEEEVGAVKRQLVSSPGISPSQMPATSRIPSCASGATGTPIPRRSAGMSANKVDQDAFHFDCVGSRTVGLLHMDSENA